MVWFLLHTFYFVTFISVYLGKKEEEISEHHEAQADEKENVISLFPQGSSFRR